MVSNRNLLLILQFFLMIYNVSSSSTGKSNHKANESILTPKRDNPNFVRDRKLDRTVVEKPPTWTHRYRLIYDPAWMDYCDPYHCNDYQTIACGLNRNMMKFKWFQSLCHLILNNQCAAYRGNTKYDLIASKFCHAYVLYPRSGCPSECDDDIDPVCGMSSVDGHLVIFKNTCALEAFNCRNSTLQEYENVYMSNCEHEYDLIPTNFCRAYVLNLRGGCQSECDDDIDPVCGMSSVDGHLVIFKNECALEAFNCRNSSLTEYESVYMSNCEQALHNPRGIN